MRLKSTRVSVGIAAKLCAFFLLVSSRRPLVNAFKAHVDQPPA